MIVGHTPDDLKKMNEMRVYSFCPDENGKDLFYVIDTLISKWMARIPDFPGNLCALSIDQNNQFKKLDFQKTESNFFEPFTTKFKNIINKFI